MSDKNMYEDEDGKLIKPGVGELYCEACARVLRKYLNAGKREREKIKNSGEFSEAFQNIKSFHYPQRLIIFGEDLVVRVLKAKI